MKFFISYAQNAEDVMLRRALRHIEHGFYIDVGAQDPVADSVTKAFYELGWRGINIDPVPRWHKALCKDRPHDINLCVAVSDHVGKLKLFDVEGSGLSTSDPAFAKGYRAEGYAVQESEVACTTLDLICKEHAVTQVHFLKIDCEGAEKAALKGMSFQQVRPWIVLVEASEPNSTTPNHQGWEKLLTGRGYRHVYSDGINRFYLAEEHPELHDAFGWPPNVLDYAMRADQARAEERAAQLEQQLAGAGDVGRIARAEAARDFLDQENKRREEALVSLRDAMAGLKGDRDNLWAENNRREEALVSLREALAGMETTAAQFVRDMQAVADERDHLRTENERREDALTALRKAHSDLERLLQARNLESERATRAHAELSVLLRKRGQDDERREGELARLGDDVHRLEEAVLSRDKEFQNAAQVHAKELRDAAQAHAAEIAIRDDELVSLRATLRRLRDAVRLREEELVHRAARLDDLLAQLAARDAETDRLRAELAAVLNSRSWRASAPLRWAGRAARGLLRGMLLVMLAILRPFARLARPVLRRMAHVGWLRSSVVRVIGRHSLIGNHARLFLFGASRPPVDMRRAGTASLQEEPGADDAPRPSTTAVNISHAGASPVVPEVEIPEPISVPPGEPATLSAREMLVVNTLQPTRVADRQPGED